MIGFGNEARDIRDPMRPQQSSAPGNTIPMSSTASPATVSPSPTSAATPSAAPQSKVAILGPTLRFKGELSAEEDFILQGSLEGSISNPQCVTIGTEGTVTGDIRARVITIDGKIEGEVQSDGSLTVGENALIKGEIKTRAVTLFGRCSRLLICASVKISKPLLSISIPMLLLLISVLLPHLAAPPCHARR